MAGTTLQISSSVMGSLLGMNEEASVGNGAVEKVSNQELAAGPDTATSSESELYYYPPTDRRLLLSSSSLPSLKSGKPRRVPGELQKETIHEEEDFDESP